MRKRYKPKSQSFSFRSNERIFAKSIRLIDAQGKQIGVVTREEALQKAREADLDIVEIGPNAVPPVVKLIDYKKFLYQMKKKKQEEKKGTQTSETKQIQLGPFIGEHDLEIKLKRAREFMNDNDKVKFTVRFKGRAITKKELGEEVLKKVIERLADIGKVDRAPYMEGRQMAMFMSRAKN
ncbi:MAG: translation initiation factor IF-3 [Candidatus Levybacteria bacterium CG10_big_fil_rev_8_21_14_0_10_36_7]|nr:MAG: translation initiation factor IF-3 [Candidatus Levybacteria bacterium CG10_big_fil_rev_8_21_14_0_10_36_7]